MTPKISSRRRMTAPPKPRPAHEHQKLHKETVVRLQRLRSAAGEVARAFVANVGRDIVEITDAITERAPRANRRVTIPLDTLGQIVDTLDRLRLKPEKGRRKDLKKIEQIIESIRKTLAKGV